MIPRGRYIGKRVGDPSKDEAEHFIRLPGLPAGGSTAVTSARCSSTKGLCRIFGTRIKRK